MMYTSQSPFIFIAGGTGFLEKQCFVIFLRPPISTFVYRSFHAIPIFFQSSHPELSSFQITFHQGDIQDPFSLLWNQAFTHILHAATVSTFGLQLTLPSDL